MNIDQAITFGLDGTAHSILKVIKSMSRVERLMMVWELRKKTSIYSKTHTMDLVQENLVRHASLVETICRRIDVIPEIRRRMRKDKAFHNNLIRYGFNLQKMEEVANKFGINRAIEWAGKDPAFRKASKNLKKQVNAEWEREVLNKFNY